jgi:hypothetical protein
LSHRHAAQKVYAEGPLHCIETAAGRQAVTLSGHAGVVDEAVEMAKVGIDMALGSVKRRFPEKKLRFGGSRIEGVICCAQSRSQNGNPG